MATFEGIYQETTPANGTWVPFVFGDYTWYLYSLTVEEKFICETCINYLDDLRCGKNVYLVYVGCNTNGCFGYESGKKCRHCGKVT